MTHRIPRGSKFQITSSYEIAQVTGRDFVLGCSVAYLFLARTRTVPGSPVYT